MSNDSQQVTPGLGRRAFVRNGLLTGLGAAVVSAAVLQRPESAQAAAAFQYEWRWCHKCQGLFYGPQQSSSACPAGGNHNNSGSYNYMLVYGYATPPTNSQNNWAWCSKCRGLFYYPHQSSSACPDGGTHDGWGSYNYNLSYTSADAISGPGIQVGWKWCNKCQGLSYGPHQSSSVCPDGGHHNINGYNYLVQWQ